MVTRKRAQASGLAWSLALAALLNTGPAEAEEPAAAEPSSGPSGETATAASEVEQAMNKAEERSRDGLPAQFMIEFGDSFDWLQLTSGEWLKGTLERMREEQVEFDSDKLDLVELDWEDVERLHCPKINTYVFENKLDVVGRAMVTKDEVLIETADGVKRYPRSDLLSIVEGAPRERNWWSAKLGAGFSANAGNTDQGSLTAYFELVRADYRTRSRARYDGTFGYADGEQNVNRQLGFADVRLFMSRRWYLTPAAAQLLNDRFQNIRFRATPGVGAGIHVVEEDKVEWDLEGGLGYQFLRSLSTVPGLENPKHDGFVSAGTWAWFEIADDIELELEWTTNFVYTTFGLTNHTGRATFSLGINDIFDFETSFLFLRTEEPPAREDGTIPASNDYQLIISIALEIG